MADNNKLELVVEVDVNKANASIKSINTGRICVLTGAGVSAERGIPTFPEPGGLWRNFRLRELATPAAFALDPTLVWEWYQWRRRIIAAAQPNAGHYALVDLENRAASFTLITQNVDGLHQRAGSRNVLEIHGSLWTARCTVCGIQQANHDVPLPALPPRSACGGMLRPGVVWFGEGLEAQVWHNAKKAVRSAELLLVAGTSAVVNPAASLVPLAKSLGARVVEINLDETPISDAVDFSLRGTSAHVLTELMK